MTANDSVLFIERLHALCELFNAKLSTGAQQLYFEALRDLEVDDIVKAMSALVCTETFMPKPAQIRELIVGDRQDHAEFAWQWLLREVRRVGYCGTPSYPDSVVKQAAEGLFGGWRALCERLPAEGPELLGYRKAFLASYNAATTAVALAPGRTAAAAILTEVTEELRVRGLTTAKPRGMS